MANNITSLMQLWGFIYFRPPSFLVPSLLRTEPELVFWRGLSFLESVLVLFSEEVEVPESVLPGLDTETGGVFIISPLPVDPLPSPEFLIALAFPPLLVLLFLELSLVVTGGNTEYHQGVL